ncbi:phage replisome organizer N-terminal domain-containing protein [Enterococcus sp. AZ101]|uniref:phage replisome organizer N-terminal domain-containing protein n=1 Tax=Enterococcus sp. AZ101 TaxID=2774742 RepID=UPI003D2809D5
MSDKQKKRYYWLKLKENFFEEDTIEWLEEQTNGKEYCLIYLKLCLKSLKTDGILARNVGNMLIPYDAETLSKITNSTVDTIKVAMDIFKKIGLIQILDGGEIYINQLNELVGSETEYAKQKRLQRAKTDNVQTLSSGCLENVAQSIELEKELEIRDKSIDIEKEKKAPKKPKPKPIRHKYGEYENVLLSDQDMEKLKSEFPNDWKDRVERVSIYCASTGKKYTNFLATIRAWAKKDKDRPQTGTYQRQPVRQETMPDWVDNPTPEEKLSAEEQAKLDAEIAAFLGKGK